MYGPPADWFAIGRAREAVRIAVVANGDLNTSSALAHCHAQSGCAHFMFGRGPMARPSLLRASAGQLDTSDRRSLSEVLLAYLELLARDAQSEARQVARVKQWLSLAKRVDPTLEPFFDSIKHILDRAELRRHLARA
jgi:tRNA-dihydrouridine synthase C